MMRILLSTIVVLLMSAGAASGQWWNVMESPCEEAVRKSLEVACAERIEACRAKKLSPDWSVDATVRGCAEEPEYREKSPNICAGDEEAIRKRSGIKWDREQKRMNADPDRCLGDNDGAKRNPYKAIGKYVTGGECEVDSNHAKLKSDLVLACESGK